MHLSETKQLTNIQYGHEILQRLRLSLAFTETKDVPVSNLDDQCHERRMLCRGDGEKDLRLCQGWM
jgi:hypothetical protein